jgi:hypothetical protein
VTPSSTSSRRACGRQGAPAGTPCNANEPSSFATAHGDGRRSSPAPALAATTIAPAAGAPSARSTKPRCGAASACGTGSSAVSRATIRGANHIIGGRPDARASRTVLTPGGRATEKTPALVARREDGVGRRVLFGAPRGETDAQSPFGAGNRSRDLRGGGFEGERHVLGRRTEVRGRRSAVDVALEPRDALRRRATVGPGEETHRRADRQARDEPESAGERKRERRRRALALHAHDDLRLIGPEPARVVQQQHARDGAARHDDLDRLRVGRDGRGDVRQAGVADERFEPAGRPGRRQFGGNFDVRLPGLFGEGRPPARRSALAQPDAAPRARGAASPREAHAHGDGRAPRRLFVPRFGGSSLAAVRPRGRRGVGDGFGGFRRRHVVGERRRFGDAGPQLRRQEPAAGRAQAGERPRQQPAEQGTVRVHVTPRARPAIRAVARATPT